VGWPRRRARNVTHALVDGCDGERVDVLLGDRDGALDSGRLGAADSAADEARVHGLKKSIRRPATGAVERAQSQTILRVVRADDGAVIGAFRDTDEEPVRRAISPSATPSTAPSFLPSVPPSRHRREVSAEGEVDPVRVLGRRPPSPPQATRRWELATAARRETGPRVRVEQVCVRVQLHCPQPTTSTSMRVPRASALSPLVSGTLKGTRVSTWRTLTGGTLVSSPIAHLRPFCAYLVLHASWHTSS